jgi:hypothetical protein
MFRATGVEEPLIMPCRLRIGITSSRAREGKISFDARGFACQFGDNKLRPVSRDSTRAYYYIINLITHFVAIRAQIVHHSQGSDKRSEERGGTAGGECLGLLLVSSVMPAKRVPVSTFEF